MQNNIHLSLHDTLCQYKLPKKLLVRFMSHCLRDIKHHLGDSKSALETMELWLADQITDAQLCDKLDNYESSYGFIYAFRAVINIINEYYLSNYRIMQAVHQISATTHIPEHVYRDKLLEMIDELTEMEKLIYLK